MPGRGVGGTVPLGAGAARRAGSEAWHAVERLVEPILGSIVRLCRVAEDDVRHPEGKLLIAQHELTVGAGVALPSAHHERVI